MKRTGSHKLSDPLLSVISFVLTCMCKQNRPDVKQGTGSIVYVHSMQCTGVQSLPLIEQRTKPGMYRLSDDKPTHLTKEGRRRGPLKLLYAKSVLYWGMM